MLIFIIICIHKYNGFVSLILVWQQQIKNNKKKQQKCCAICYSVSRFITTFWLPRATAL